MTRWAAVATFIVLSGCATKNMIVVHDGNTPNSGTFTVIPSVTVPGVDVPKSTFWINHVVNPTVSDVEFANAIEADISGLGLKVIERPPFKFLKTSTPNKDGGTTSTKIMDVVAMYADTEADYIVVTYQEGKNVRIVRKQDGAVIATMKLSTNFEENWNELRQALIAANLLKEGGAPK